MNVFQAVGLALVQAATEFFPVSSSGHLLFLKGIFGIRDIPLMFDIIVHAGSLTAIVGFYRRRILGTLRGASAETGRRPGGKPHRRFLSYLLISTMVTFGLYSAFRSFIEAEYGSPRILPLTFLLSSLLLLSTRLKRASSGEPVARKGADVPAMAGVFQAIAIFPGVSRSGATISSMLMMGVEREEAAYYSFFLAVPAILGALIFHLLEMENLDFIASQWHVLMLSFLVSAAGSFGFLALLNFLIRRGRFWAFGVYTLCMAVVSLVLFVL